MPPALLSGLGNQAVQRALAGPRLMRVRKSPEQMSTMTVRAFDTYRKTAAMDWANLGFDEAERTSIWKLLDWGIDGLASFQLKDVLRWMSKPEGADALKHYCDALNGQYEGGPTTRLNPRANLKDAVTAGRWMGRLNAKLSGPLMRAVIPPAVFDDLIATASVARQFRSYYERRKPILQAPNGKDTTSFITLVKTETADPLEFEADLPHIRNIHKFSKASLTKLKTDKTTAGKPLTLILQGLYDHNGAFVRHEHVAKVIANANVRAYVVEGPNPETLAKLAETDIAAIAAQYGIDGKITQVMIAGHGNARRMGLGGEGSKVTHDATTGGYKVDKDVDRSLTFSHKSDDQFWTPFFEALFDNMAMKNGLKPKVVLRACLTASNEVNVRKLKAEMAKDGRIDVDAVDPTTPENQVKIRAGIVEYIRRHGSLAKVLGDKAAGRATVEGAQGSITNKSAGSIRSTGEIGVIGIADTHVSGTKPQYVRHGKEPLGALRAVIESWADDKDTCFKLMGERVAAPVSTADDLIIQLLYRTILSNFANDILGANDLVGTASVLSGIESGGDGCKPSRLRDDAPTKRFRSSFYPLLEARFPRPSSKLALYQDWMDLDTSKREAFVDVLGEANVKWSDATKFLDFEMLKPHLTAIFALSETGMAAFFGFTGTTQKGCINLALAGAVEHDDGACRTFLLKQVGQDQKLSAAVKEALGTHSERRLREKLGLPVDERTTTGAVRQYPKNAGDANDFHVEPMTATTKSMSKATTADAAKLMPEPKDSAVPLAQQDVAKDYSVVGDVKTTTGADAGWYMIRMDDGTVGYMRKRYF